MERPMALSVALRFHVRGDFRRPRDIDSRCSRKDYISVFASLREVLLLLDSRLHGDFSAAARNRVTCSGIRSASSHTSGTCSGQQTTPKLSWSW
jgi:hypothetical protein